MARQLSLVPEDVTEALKAFLAGPYRAGECSGEQYSVWVADRIAHPSPYCTRKPDRANRTMLDDENELAECLERWTLCPACSTWDDTNFAALISICAIDVLNHGGRVVTDKYIALEPTNMQAISAGRAGLIASSGVALNRWLDRSIHACSAERAATFDDSKRATIAVQFIVHGDWSFFYGLANQGVDCATVDAAVSYRGYTHLLTPRSASSGRKVSLIDLPASVAAALVSHSSASKLCDGVVDDAQWRIAACLHADGMSLADALEASHAILTLQAQDQH